MSVQSIAKRAERVGWDLTLPMVVICVLATAMGWWLYHAMYAAPLPATLDESEDATFRVTRVLDVLKVVTQEVETRVSAQRHHENWRGRVEVEIEAPVKLLYGVDLTSDAVQVETRTPGYVRVVVPEPRLLYHDFDPSRIVEKRMHISGMRTRTGAGQTQLTLCIYEDLPREIRKVASSRKLLEQVREQSRAQLRELFQAVLPEDTWVEIRFKGEEAIRAGAARQPEA